LFGRTYNGRKDKQSGGKMKTNKTKKKSFEEHSCEVKNEKDCEDELDEEDVKMEEAEEEMFGEE
jgi:hypothetical protein